nr:MAG TPA: head closure knob [Caudoviricetes sp.]
MRFDTPIYFQSVVRGEYNATTGDYADDTAEEVERYASVSDTGTDTLTLVYGGLKQGSLTIRLQSVYDGIFDYIRIGSKRYRVDKTRTLRNKQTFIVSEVQ